MSANRTELTRSTSPGSPAAPNGVTVGAAVSPAAPQVLDAAAAATASRLTPAPTTAAMATHLRRVLGVGDGVAAVPAAARPEAVSPRDIAATVRDIMSPRGGEGGGAPPTIPRCVYGHGRLKRGTIAQIATCPGNELLVREAFARVAFRAPIHKWPLSRYMHTPTIYSSTSTSTGTCTVDNRA